MGFSHQRVRLSPKVFKQGYATSFETLRRYFCLVLELVHHFVPLNFYNAQGAFH